VVPSSGPSAQPAVRTSPAPRWLSWAVPPLAANPDAELRVRSRATPRLRRVGRRRYQRFPLITDLLPPLLVPNNVFLREGPRANKSGGPWRFLPTAANSAEMNPSRKSAVTQQNLDLPAAHVRCESCTAGADRNRLGHGPSFGFWRNPSPHMPGNRCDRRHQHIRSRFAGCVRSEQ
jgi:hypothetical protein